MPNLFDLFTGRQPSAKKKTLGKKFNGKLTPKNERLCPGCPPGLVKAPVPPPIVLPDPNDSKEDTKVVTLVNLSGYKKKPKSPNGLF